MNKGTVKIQSEMPDERGMPCKSCGSGNQSKFNGEIGIHFPGLKGIDKPIILLFPKVLVCLNCGFAEFHVSEDQLRKLAKDDAAAAGSV